MTLSALGIFSAAGAGGVVASGAYELISTTTLGTAVSSVTFSNLGDYAPTYRHLQIRAVTRVATGNDNTLLRINGDAGNNYSWHELFTYTPATSVQSGSANSVSSIKVTYSDSATANQFGVGIIDLLDVYSTAKNKTVRTFAGATDDYFVGLRSGLWMNTSSITSLTILGAGGFNLAVGSRFSLYGIKG